MIRVIQTIYRSEVKHHTGRPLNRIRSAFTAIWFGPVVAGHEAYAFVRTGDETYGVPAVDSHEVVNSDWYYAVIPTTAGWLPAPWWGNGSPVISDPGIDVETAQEALAAVKAYLAS